MKKIGSLVAVMVLFLLFGYNANADKTDNVYPWQSVYLQLLHEVRENPFSEKGEEVAYYMLYDVNKDDTELTTEEITVKELKLKLAEAKELLKKEYDKLYSVASRLLEEGKVYKQFYEEMQKQFKEKDPLEKMLLELTDKK